jgi:hypothetical protein
LIARQKTGYLAAPALLNKFRAKEITELSYSFGVWACPLAREIAVVSCKRKSSE